MNAPASAARTAGPPGPWVHIGVEGPASVWFRRTFVRGHPELRLFHAKHPEAHALVQELHAPPPLGLDHPRWQVLQRAVKPIAGKISVGSTDLLTGDEGITTVEVEAALERLVGILPSVGFVLVLREQGAAIAATYAAHLARGGALSAERFVHDPTRFDPSVLDYHWLLGRLHDRVGADRVLTLVDEQRQVDAGGMRAEVCHRLGISPDGGDGQLPPDDVSGRQRYPGSVLLHRALNRRYGDPGSSRVGADLAERWRDALSGRTYAQASLEGSARVPRLPASVLRWVRERYASGNTEVSGVLGRDLGEFGYATS